MKIWKPKTTTAAEQMLRPLFQTGMDPVGLEGKRGTIVTMRVLKKKTTLPAELILMTRARYFRPVQSQQGIGVKERDDDDNEDIENNDDNHGKVDPDDRTEQGDSDLYGPRRMG